MRFTSNKFKGSSRGMFLPLILVGVVIVAILFIAFFKLSISSRKKVSWNEDRIKARYVAESALAAAAAAIYQNKFEKRWYKKSSTPNGKYGGFCGEATGKYAGGSYRIVAEDITKTDGINFKDRKSIDEFFYNRIDIFAEGTYGSYTVVAYQVIALLPEERVYKIGSGGNTYEVR